MDHIIVLISVQTIDFQIYCLFFRLACDRSSSPVLDLVFQLSNKIADYESLVTLNSQTYKSTYKFKKSAVFQHTVVSQLINTAMFQVCTKTSTIS